MYIVASQTNSEESRLQGRPFWFWMLLTLTFALAGGGTAEAAGRGAGAPDGNAIVRKMVATYQKASTIQETAEAKIIQLGGSLVTQSTSLKYKKPNRIVISSVDPITGTLTGYSDGSSVVIYSGKQNIFTRRVCPSALADVLNLFRVSAEASLGAPLEQVLSPATFLVAQGMPNEAKSFRYVRTMTVDGHEAYRVDGLVDIAFVKGLAPDLNIQPVQRVVILWIDTKTSLLVRAILALKWLTTRPGEPKTNKPRYPAGFAFEEVHKDTVLNAPLDDSLFHFSAPKAALEKMQKRGSP